MLLFKKHFHVTNKNSQREKIISNYTQSLDFAIRARIYVAIRITKVSTLVKYNYISVFALVKRKWAYVLFCTFKLQSPFQDTRRTKPDDKEINRCKGCLPQAASSFFKLSYRKTFPFLLAIARNCVFAYFISLPTPTTTMLTFFTCLKNTTMTVKDFITITTFYLAFVEITKPHIIEPLGIRIF